MKTEIRWSPLAVEDLRAIRTWLRARNSDEAVRFSEAIKNTVRLLEKFPHLGPVARDLEPRGRFRHVIQGKHRVIYRVEAGVLRILRVWDCRRNPEDLTQIE